MVGILTPFVYVFAWGTISVYLFGLRSLPNSNKRGGDQNLHIELLDDLKCDFGLSEEFKLRFGMFLNILLLV